MSSRLNTYSLILCPLLLVLSLAAYLFTLSPGAFPGNSAGLIAYHTGIDPFDTMLQPVWHVFVRIIAALPMGELSFRLNVFSAICGALSVVLLYWIVASVPHDKSPEEGRSVFSASRAQVLSGLTAALFFAFSIPFWSVSNRAHFLSFDILFFLICTWMFLRVWQINSRRLLYVFAMLYGMGMVQSANFIIAAPVFAFYILFHLIRLDSLKLRLLLNVAGFGVLGLLIIIPAAWLYYQVPVFEWRELGGFHNLLWAMVRDQGYTALNMLRQAGWILLFLTTALPWFAVVAFKKKPSHEMTARVGSLLFHLVVTALGVILIFNIPPSPLGVVEDGSQLAFPYVLVAAWLGYIAGYWFALMSGPKSARREWPSLLRHTLRTVWVVAVLGVLGAGAVRNLPEADGRTSAAANILARSVVDNLGDRTWLLSNGLLDANIMIIAAEQGKELVILNPRFGTLPAYQNYMASLFTDQRMRGLAQLGLAPLVNEWLQTDRDIEHKLAVLTSPELWAEAGLYPVPSVSFFAGTREAQPSVDADAFMDKHRALWLALLAHPAGEKGQFADRYTVWARAHVSKVANNAGVFLEDLGEEEKAFECYTAARDLDRDNISALMNQLSLATRNEWPQAETLNEELEQYLAAREGRASLWALSATYGYVRDPQAYVRQGMAWAMSGRIRSAMADIERAIGMTGSNPRLQHVLATLYMTADRAAAGEEIYLRLLSENPDDANAILGLYRLAITRGDIATARTHLARLQELNVPRPQIIVEEALLATAEGGTDGAIHVLQTHVETHPRDARAWGVLTTLAVDAGRHQVVTQALQEISRMERVSPELMMVVAQAQISQGYLAAARDTLNRLLRAHPANAPALEQLLRLDVQEGNRDAALRHVERLLSVDAGSAIGNYILGTLQASRRDYALAEISMRRSLERHAMPEALNDLAWLLQMRGEYDEAYPLIRRAIEINPRNANAWSTYGVVLMGRGDLEEAGEALHQALQMQPGNPVIQLNLAELYERMNMPTEATQLVDEVMSGISLLSEDDRKRALDLSTRLRRE